MYTFQELQHRGRNELLSELEIARRKAYELRMGLKTRQEAKIHEYKKQKKYVAQILMLLGQLPEEEKKQVAEVKSVKEEKPAVVEKKEGVKKEVAKKPVIVPSVTEAKKPAKKINVTKKQEEQPSKEPEKEDKPVKKPANKSLLSKLRRK